MNLGHFAGLQAAGPLDRRDGRGNVRDLPPRVRNESFVFSVRDRGIAQWKTNTTAYTWTIPDERTVGTFPDGFSVPVFNHGGSGNISIATGFGVTLTEGATSGSISLLPGNSRLLCKVPGTVNQWRLW
jgi:hypothetical protein